MQGTRDEGHMIKTLRVVMLAITVMIITSCANVAMTGASAVYNRHSIQKNINDQYITMMAFKQLKIDDDQFDDSNITIATYDSDVLLTGQVPRPWQKEKAEKIVKTIPDVGHVYNLLSIASPSSSLTRISDAWITTKIKSKFLVSDDVDVAKVKVVTENGTVYMMGLLQPYEAQTAADIASHTDGVENVVKMFSYMRISKK